MTSMQRIYLDYAASTPVDPRVFKAMRPYFNKEFGNPGSLHSFGQKAMAAVDLAREEVARSLGRPAGEGFREIIFTGSATEANNLALRGMVRGWRMRIENENIGNTQSTLPSPSSILHPRLIVSSIEHESVLETAKDLERDGVEVVYLPVDKKGRVKLSALKAALTPETVLVSVMYGNNETGTIQPIAEIAKIIREFRIENLEFSRKQKGGNSLNPKSYILNSEIYPLLHTDASQCFAYLDCDPDKLGVDLMTISGHKMGGPKGVGALWMRQSDKRQATSDKFKSLSHFPVYLSPLLTGGGQEFGLRSATENVPAIVGFGKAAVLAVAERTKNSLHVFKLREAFLAGLRKIKPDLAVNGDGLPHILSLRLPGLSAADLLTALDLRGVAISSGSACRSRSFEPSHVLMEMGGIRLAKESIRVSFGRSTTPSEVRAALAVAKAALKSVS